MASLCAYAFIAALAAFRLTYAACQPEAVQDGPVLTRVTEPVSHGEGPHWDPVDKVLYYVDISGQTLHRYDPATKADSSLKLDKPVCLVVPIRGQKNEFVVGLGRELVRLHWEWDTGVHYHSTIITVDEHEPRNRFNDGKADANGRIWAGTIGVEEPIGNVQMNKATFYRLDNNASRECVGDVQLRPVSISNGLAWSGDNKVLYYIDSPTRRVDAFDFSLDSGSIANQRTVFTFGDQVDGSPDGMTIDGDGNLWIACWGGSQVIRVDPRTGKLLRSIKLPASRVSSVTWGGPTLDTLYVTTMRLGLDETQLLREPYAGSVWEVSNLKAIGTPQHTAVVGCKCKQ